MSGYFREYCAPRTASREGFIDSERCRLPTTVTFILRAQCYLVTGEDEFRNNVDRHQPGTHNALGDRYRVAHICIR